MMLADRVEEILPKVAVLEDVRGLAAGRSPQGGINAWARQVDPDMLRNWDKS
jgi:hypothetical protein